MAVILTDMEYNNAVQEAIRCDESNLRPANQSHFYHLFHNFLQYLACQLFLLYLDCLIFLSHCLYRQLLRHKFPHLQKILLLLEFMDINTISIYPVYLNRSVKLFMEPLENISIRMEFNKPANVIVLSGALQLKRKKRPQHP